MRPALVVAAAVLASTACTGEVPDPGARPTPSLTTPAAVNTSPECPPVSRLAKDGWPKDVPGIIPRPAGLKVDDVNRAKGNVTQVRTTVPMSIRDSLLYIVKEFPKAGFTLGRGDAEATEVDAPFQRGEALRGLVRVFITRKDCETLWLYAVVRETSAPYDIAYTPPPSSTPLPFG